MCSGIRRLRDFSTSAKRVAAQCRGVALTAGVPGGECDKLGACSEPVTALTMQRSSGARCCLLGLRDGRRQRGAT